MVDIILSCLGSQAAFWGLEFSCVFVVGFYRKWRKPFCLRGSKNELLQLFWNTGAELSLNSGDMSAPAVDAH